MIPRIAHFCWFGSKLPWIHVLALRSAALRGGFDSVRLHHADPLEPESVAELSGTPGVELVPMDVDALMTEAGGRRLAEVCRELSSPVAKSNLVRAAVVYRDGGVYLDMDTVTIRSFGSLCESSEAFVGLEHIVFPYRVRRSKDPAVLAKAYGMTLVRELFRLLPEGYRAFRRIERHYPKAVNGAILGGRSGHPYLRAYLDAMVEVPVERRLVPHALGTHLLQEVTERYEGGDLTLCEPEVFYPLAPEISHHWFREHRRPVVDDAVTPKTLLVHWYASVRTKRIVPAVDERYVDANADKQLFSRLAADVLRATAS